MENQSGFFKNNTDLNFTMLEVNSEKSAQKAKVNFFEKVLVRTDCIGTYRLLRSEGIYIL